MKKNMLYKFNKKNYYTITTAATKRNVWGYA